MCSDINYIIHMSLNGDKNYQEILLEKLKPLIYKNIYSYWNPSDTITEDLAQEGYVLILESLKNYDEKRNVHFLQYIKIKIIYFYKNYYRSTIKRNEITLADNISNISSSILDILIDKEEMSELLTSFKVLNIKEQMILYLFYYQQHSISEISKILNIPYHTVKGKKQVAIKKLKKLYRR